MNQRWLVSHCSVSVCRAARGSKQAWIFMQASVIITVVLSIRGTYMQTILLIWQSLIFFTYLLMSWLIGGHNCSCLFGAVALVMYMIYTINLATYVIMSHTWDSGHACMGFDQSPMKQAEAAGLLVQVHCGHSAGNCLALNGITYEHGIQWYMTIASHNQLHLWFWICSLDVIDVCNSISEPPQGCCQSIPCCYYCCFT